MEFYYNDEEQSCMIHLNKKSPVSIASSKMNASFIRTCKHVNLIISLIELLIDRYTISLSSFIIDLR